MEKPYKNNKRNQLILIIIWGLVLALTLIGVYMYYENKIEQLEPVGHRTDVLPVRRASENPPTSVSGEKCRRNGVADCVKRGVCSKAIAVESVAQPYQRSVNTPMILPLYAPESVPSRATLGPETSEVSVAKTNKQVHSSDDSQPETCPSPP